MVAKSCQTDLQEDIAISLCRQFCIHRFSQPWIRNVEGWGVEITGSFQKAKLEFISYWQLFT